jgi:hypothetical protein
VLALRESRRLPLQTALTPIFGWAGAFGAAMLWMYPVNATDIFLYAVRSRLLTAYGANPLVALAKNYPKDAWHHFATAQWAGIASPYGPLWNLIAAPITYLAGDRMTVALIGFKLLSLLSVLGVGWAIARSLAARGDTTRATGLLLFLWNPLVLWEAVGNGHNDVVMALPLLLALLAWSTHRDELVIPWLVVGGAIKYVPVLVIPLAAIACWQRTGTWPARRRLVVWSAVWSAVALLVAFFPFYNLHAAIASMQHQANILRLSPASVAFTWLVPRLRGGDPRPWLRLVGTIVLGGALVYQGFVVWRRPSRLPRAMFEVLCVFLIASTWYFNGWYLIWLVGLAALLPWGWASWRMIAWTASAMAAYGLAIWFQAWWRIGFRTSQMEIVALTFVPALLCMLAESLARIGRRRANSKVLSMSPAPSNVYRALRRQP